MYVVRGRLGCCLETGGRGGLARGVPGRTLARREQLCAPRRMAEEHISGDDDKSTSPAQDA